MIRLVEGVPTRRAPLGKLPELLNKLATMIEESVKKTAETVATVEAVMQALDASLPATAVSGTEIVWRDSFPKRGPSPKGIKPQERA